MDKIQTINRAIEEYFAFHKSVDIVPAKDLMTWFIKKGVFDSDTKGGLPIRRILRTLNRKGQLGQIPSAFPDQKAKNINWYFIRSGSEVSASGRKAAPTGSRKRSEMVPRASSGRSSSDEEYVIDLCDEALGLKASRQHRFDFLRGDPGQNRQGVTLPVDAYYESLSLVIEFREKQHTEEVKHFDKPGVMTVSGVHRGEQRKLYDQRRREVLPKHGIKLIEISYSDFQHDSGKKIVRDRSEDLLTVRSILNKQGFDRK